MREYIILIVFVVLVAILLPYMFHKYPALFYATEMYVITTKDLVRFISDCIWIDENKVHYDLTKLSIIYVDHEDHNSITVESLDNIFFSISISNDGNGIEIICSEGNGIHYMFEKTFFSLSDKWDFTDNPNFMYLQNLYEQMLYAEVVCNRFHV